MNIGAILCACKQALVRTTMFFKEVYKEMFIVSLVFQLIEINWYCSKQLYLIAINFLSNKFLHPPSSILNDRSLRPNGAGTIHPVDEVSGTNCPGTKCPVDELSGHAS